MKKFIVIIVLSLLPFSANAGGLEEILKENGVDILTGVISGSRVDCKRSSSGKCNGVIVTTGSQKTSGSIGASVSGKKIFGIDTTGVFPKGTFCFPSC